MVLTFKPQQLRLLGVTALLVLLNACSTMNTMPQPSVQDRSTPAEVSTARVKSTTTATPTEETQINRMPQPDVIVEEKAAVPVIPKSSTPVQQNAAVVALINTAQQQQQKGDLYSAQTSLQRAQRISPRDPQVYYELATIHEELQDYALAEQVALKGVSLVQGQPEQLQRFWRLIASIRKSAGDSAGARQAEQMAERY